MNKEKDNKEPKIADSFIKESTILDKFKILVEEAAKNKTNLVINNGSYGHAQILFEKIIESAEDYISLLSRQCNPSFYDKEEIYNAFLKFVNKKRGDGKIRIIFEEEPVDKIINNPFIKKVLKYYAEYGKTDSFEVYKLNDANAIKVDSNVFHLLLADKKGPYRFEVHLERKTTDESWQVQRTDAVANFGDEEQSAFLWEFFENQKVTNTTKITL